MTKVSGFSYDIQYTKAAEKFFRKHEDIRTEYESSIKELMVGEFPEKVDVKRIKGKHSNYYRIRLGGYRVVYTIINGTMKPLKFLKLIAAVPATIITSKQKPLIRFSR